MRRSRYAIFGFMLVLQGCSEVAGIEAIPCAPACKDETTRIVCDAAGQARTEVCPASNEECAVPACEAGACAFKPAIGAPCGDGGLAQCNEGFACIERYSYMNSLYRHTCLAAADGKVWCWGDNTYGQLGDGTDRPGLHPVLVRGLPGPAHKVLTGYGHTCALLRNSELYCWGNNQNGQCGNLAPPISAPVLVHVPGTRFIEVLPGDQHTCALTADKTVYCWGNTEYGQCGSDPALTGPHIVGPTQVPDLNGVVAIQTVKNHTCAVRSENPTLMCWGSNSHVQPPERSYVNGKLGLEADNLSYSAVPIPVDIGSPVVAVGMGVEATYALTRNGLYAWGENDRFQLGVESRETIVRTPTAAMVETGAGLVPLSGVFSVLRSAGSDQCVVMANRLDFDASFLCWGADDWGELGVGTEEGARTTHRYPLPVRALPPVSGWLARGEDHACAAVSTYGRTEIECFGHPGFLGNGTPRAEDGDPPSYWRGTPVVWDPSNFAPALAPTGE